MTHRVIRYVDLGATLLLVLFGSGACEKIGENRVGGAPSTASSTPAMRADDNGTEPHRIAAGQTELSGTVAETIEVGKYTYLRVDRPQGAIWAAVPRARVGVGQRVTITNSMPMRQFESKTLKRKFPLIYFGTLGGESIPSPHGKGLDGTALDSKARDGKALDRELGAAHRQVTAPSAKPSLQHPLEKATGPNGQTIAEIFDHKDELQGKTIVLRGKVIKVNDGIMDRNWVHVEDGTRSRSDAHELTVTTQETVQLGQVIVVQGTLALDRDFGAGYRYPVILEQATLKK